MWRNVLKVAFKEWVVVVKALGGGRQSIILRKGGIHEKGGCFTVEYPTFLLFPTFEHQQEKDVQPEFRHWLKETEEKGKQARGKIAFEYFAEIAETWKIRDIAKLSELSALHIWSPEAVRKRFEYGKEKSLFLLLVRVYRLPAITTVENQPSYAGCKSWVPLQDEVSIENASPVLEERSFLELRRTIEKRIAE